MAFEALAPVAVVTGGTGGVGRAVSAQLAERGYRIAFTFNRNLDGARALKNDLAKSGTAAIFDCPALSNATEIDIFVSNVLKEYGRIDAVVHAAGPYVKQRFVSELSSGQFRRHVDLELVAFFEIVRSTLPYLRQSRGSITAVTTFALRRFPGRDALSSAPKGGIEALITALAVEEGRFGVRANAVGAGIISDGMGIALESSGDVTAKMREQNLRDIPMKRMGVASEVAEVATFLASDAASYVTGQSIDVDGGYSL